MKFKKGYQKVMLTILLIIVISFLVIRSTMNDDDSLSITGMVVKDSVEKEDIKPIQDLHKEFEKHGWTPVASDKDLRYSDDD